MTEPFNPFALLRAAATGDITAQRQLADGACMMAATQPDFDPLPIISDGLVFARLAAAHGETADAGRLISMLVTACNLCSDERQYEYAGEALAVAERMAEAGDESVADVMPSLAEQLPLQVVAYAQDYRKRMAAE